MVAFEKIKLEKKEANLGNGALKDSRSERVVESFEKCRCFNVQSWLEDIIMEERP